MKKVIKKTKSTVASSKVTSSSPELLEREYKVCGVDKLHVVFQNEDMNKVVEKINEIIEKQCH